MNNEILRGIYEFLKPQVGDSIRSAKVFPNSLLIHVSDIEHWTVTVEESKYVLDTGSQYGIVRAIAGLFEQAFEKGWCEAVTVGDSQIYLIKESKIWVIRFKRVK